MTLPGTEESVKIIEKREIAQEIISETNPEGTNPEGTNPEGTSPEGTSPEISSEIFPEETSELIETRQEHSESALHDSLFTESDTSQFSIQATEDDLFRTKSDYCLIQAKRELFQGRCLQKRHTNLGDTPYNTNPISEIRPGSNSFSDSGTILFAPQQSLGPLSPIIELPKIPNLDHVFSILDKPSQSLSTRDSGDHSSPSFFDDREEELDHSHLEEEESYNDKFSASL